MRETVQERLERFIDRRPDGCWWWTGSKDNWGYGHVSVNGRTARTHRVAYELFVGPIPAGLSLDHLCRNRACCNPAHLEPVTVRENTTRSDSASANNARKTHCKYGHEFTPENTRLCRNGQRACRACQHARDIAKRVVAHKPNFNGSKATCPQGHPYGDQTYIRNGKRYCRECHKLHERERRARNKQAA